MEKINVNSSENQNIKRDFVNREVYANVGEMTEYILNQNDYSAPFTYDDISNLYDFACPECGVTMRKKENENGKTIYICDNCEHSTDDYSNLEQNQKEVYEWWIISEYLAKKMQNKNEVIIDTGYNFIWGRCCTGQAIYLDYVISNICKELNLLK